MKQLRITKLITNRSSEPLDKYLKDIGKIPLITIAEEVELCRRIKEGDQRAFEKLVEANLRFVVSVAKQYQNKGMKLLDLINEGNLGLMKAAKRFDDTRGFKFISYAVWWIRQGILQAIAEQSRMIRLPLNKISELSRISKTISSFEYENERSPTPEEISFELGVTETSVRDIQRVSTSLKSLDAPLLPDGTGNMYDVHLPLNYVNSTEHYFIEESLKIEIMRVLKTLPARESEIIKMFYGLDNYKSLNLNEISETMGLTRERIRQIKEKTIKKLGHSSKSNILKWYLGKV